MAYCTRIKTCSGYCYLDSIYFKVLPYEWFTLPNDR
nr:MAG TPA: papain-like endopeptidase [Caudoviricetes sp.]